MATHVATQTRQVDCFHNRAAWTDARRNVEPQPTVGAALDTADLEVEPRRVALTSERGHQLVFFLFQSIGP